MKILNNILFLFALSVLIACSGSKAMTKKGRKLEENGMYSEAADFYLNALYRKTSNVEARIGLQNTGQKKLNDQLDNFFKHYTSGDDKKAVKQYLDAVKYQKKIKELNVDLDIPKQYFNDFKEVKERYLSDLYDEGIKLMAEEKFDQAKIVFSELKRIEPKYKDTHKMDIIAQIEPKYRKGVEMMGKEEYRKAYNYFKEVEMKNSNYKDTDELMKEVLSLGQYNIAIFPSENSTNYQNIDDKIVAYFSDKMTNYNDPFVRLVARKNIQEILDEQRLGLSGVVDENSAAQVGELVGAKAAFKVNVVDYRETKGSLRKTKKQGFESYQVKVENEDGTTSTKTKYQKATYYEYYAMNQVMLVMQYQLISLETGEVLSTKLFERSVNDEINYATYQGNHNKLFPSKDGKVHNAGKRSLRRLLKARKTIKSTANLSNDICKDAATISAKNIMNITKYKS